ncbi:MAG: tetratricopeptide repeat protein [Pseudomonadota bacterium]
MPVLRPFQLVTVLALSALVAVPLHARGTAGAYLAARHASFDSDFVKAAEYYTRALALDSSNPSLMENAIGSNVSLGQFDRALPIANRMLRGQHRSQVAALVILADQVDRQAYDEILTDLDAGATVGALIDGLTRAWALMGEGRASDAMAAFDEVAAEEGLKSFALYHKSLALASAGDFEGADDILSGRAAGTLSGSRRTVLAHAQILSQLDRPQDALELIEASYGPNLAPTFDAMADQLRAGEVLDYDVATTAREGLAEVFYSVGTVLSGEATSTYTLVYSRMSEFLNPGHVDAILLSAALLEELEQYDLAVRSYDAVPLEHPAFVAAEIGRADAMLAADKTEAAIEVLHQLAKAHPDLLVVQMTLGDTLRRLDRFAQAATAYDRAIELIGAAETQHWVVFFARGITYERTDRWDEAEADFRKALELRPDQPQVLNYLGYSLVELQINLDEALQMIEQAVAARPDDGYITDSLGWVLFRLGRYDEAVTYMEKAAELLPVDPIINDHLGDVYWAVGRHLEAQFQWRRALSFDPEEEEALRIRKKLEVGLDIVLEEEGADPIAVANDDG